MAVSEELKIVVKAEVNKAVAGLKKIQTQTAKTEKGFKKFGSEIGRMVLAFGSATAAIALLRKGLSFAIEASKLAADANQVGMALESMADAAGISGKQMLKDLSEAAGGTIDSLALMKQASRALVFDIAPDKLQGLMKIARASATATGESVEQMFNSIVTGVARGSRMLLDNLGILVNVEQAQANYAKILGKTVEEMTASEKSQATLNAVLESGADIMERVGEAGRIVTDAERFQRLSAAMTDLKIEVGKTLLDAFLPMLAALGDTAREAATASQNVRELRDAMKQLEGPTGEAGDASNALVSAYATLRKLQIVPTEFGLAQIKMVEKTIAALEEQLKRENLLRLAREHGDFVAMERAAREAKAAADAAKHQQGILTWVQKVDAAWGLTPEGRQAAAEADIAMWEGMLRQANLTAPQIEDIIAHLKQQFDESFGGVVVAGQSPIEKARMELALLEDDMARFGAGQGLDIAKILGGGGEVDIALPFEQAAEAAALMNDELYRMGAGGDIDVAATLGGIEEAVYNLESAIETGLLRAFDALGQALVSGEEGFKIFAKGVIGSIVGVLDALAAQMIAVAIAEAALLTLNPGAAIAAAAAIKVATGIIKAGLASMEEGGVTQKEGMYHLHPNEAVIPLDKAMGRGGDTIIIMGDLLTQEEAYSRVTEYQQSRARPY